MASDKQVAGEGSDILGTLAPVYQAGSRRIHEQFERDHQPGGVLRERTHVVDRVVTALFSHLVAGGPGEPQGLCLAAVGGYGRRELHPCSDIDVTFVCANAAVETAYQESTAALLRALWDLGLRSSGGLRTLAECRTVLATDPEFAVALLDVRYLAGDPQLFGALHDRLLPEVIARERQSLVANLETLTRQRHQKYAGTIFHLEPNIKDAPGGLRDYHVARWLAEIAALDERGAWSAPESLWPQAFSSESRAAFAFLTATRCFLHYRRERDDNLLTYEMQDQAACEAVGSETRAPLTATEWMRAYFRHARRINALVARLLDETTRGRRSLSAVFEDWRTRLSNNDFSVIGGRVFPRRPAAAADAAVLLRLFEMVARHDLQPSAEAERWVADVLPRLTPTLNEFPEAALSLQEVLTSAHAAAALRAMHRLGVLTALVPEFCGIDALVTRDFYHRYTVDEHTFVAVQAVHELEKLKARKGSVSEGVDPGLARIEQRFAGLLAEIDRAELLYLALLLHDLGKGTSHANHVQGSVEIAQQVLARLGTSPDEDRTVLFLIAHHVDMSSTLLRRDILDPGTIREFAHKIGSVERLKLLTLLTYADIKAVNTEALTPWKADALWQLYVSTANDLARSLDDDRVSAGDAAADAFDIDATLTAGQPTDQPSELHGFLRGFPQRYLAVHAPGEILEHLEMARALEREPARMRLEREHAFWELTLVTRDRPLLFATVTGALASWGMSIVKAEAFANAQGIVLDVFAFQDLHRTLDLNPSEIARFEQDLMRALTGKLTLETLLSDATGKRVSLRPAKVTVATQLRFDDVSSKHSTLLELITADRPGLLFDVSYALARSGCNIEVALIDTEGQRVIDVFYLTAGGSKLTGSQQEMIRSQLVSLLTKPAGERPAAPVESRSAAGQVRAEPVP
ncbi:MAG TPA: [protein-PII] uridylyltransferase [Terriglobia bacterium]|nr:[protein-PII] uridylyltransferase [Terriglobia bacterium]